MSNIFSNKKAVKSEKVEDDYIGGAKTLETDIYPAEIKYAYIGKSRRSDARNITLCLKVDGKTEVTRSIWMTNGQGDVTYKDKKTGEERNLPGYNQVNSLAMLLLSKEIGDLDVEERTLNLYDFESKKEIPQAVDCFIELHGLNLQVAIQKQIIDKNEKNEATGDYEPSGETVTVNEFIKFFPEDKRVTISEVAHYIQSLGGDFDEVLSDGELMKAIERMPDEGDYAAAWLEKNQGETWDRSVGKKTEGKSFNASGGGEKKSKSSLFDD